MKDINLSKLMLAILVVLMFCLVGVSFAYANLWSVALFTILGFALMGYGIATRNKESN